MQIERTTVTMLPKQQLMLHTVSDREAIVKRARRLARRTGGVIKWGWNGNEEWYVFSEVVDTTNEASGQYTWHADGERVLHRVEQHTRTATGEVLVRKLESVYRKMEG